MKIIIMGSPVFKTILIKLSGEVLMGEDKFGFNSKAVSNIVDEIISSHNLNIRLAIVIGGGNIFRGVNLANQGLDRATGDYMGMLATVMNAIALKDILNTKISVPEFYLQSTYLKLLSLILEERRYRT